jgi:2-methylcitrate dehydratase
MTEVEQLGVFVTNVSYEGISPHSRQALKSHVLDSLGCAIGALDGEPIKLLRAHVDEFGGAPLATLIGGGRTAPDRAAFYNSALIRYLDFNDSFLAKGETCHPSDNLGAILATSEYAGRDGKDFLTAMAVAYQVQCRLSEVAPVRSKGFDHVTQGAYAAAAGVARSLGLDGRQTAHAIAISGTAFNALRVTRTGKLSHWKGLAYPNTAFSATHAAFLARRGITGPLEVFEGNKGFKEAISGPFKIDWQGEDLTVIERTILKKFNAEIHSQTSLECILELRAREKFEIEDIDRIELSVFDVAFNIIGGGEEGDKHRVQTKEQADHSLPYMIAVALLDGDIGPAQYSPERIVRSDVQTLLRKVHVHADDAFSRTFPNEMPARIRIVLRGGRTLMYEKKDYEGFYTRPMPWDAVVAKFERLATPFTGPELRHEIVSAISNIESIGVRELTGLLARAGRRN